MRFYQKAGDEGGGEAGSADGNGKDPDLIVVGDGAEGVPGAAAEQQQQTRDDEGGGEGGRRDDARAGDDENDERGGDDERLGRSEDDPDSEQRGGRRESRAEKNERRRRARDRDRTELRYLRTRNEQLERGASETAQRLDKLERHDEDERLGRLKNAIRNADATIVKLTAAGEEAQALEATTIKNNLQDQLEREQRRAAAERTAPHREEGDGGRRDDARGGGEGEGGLSATAKRNALAWQARNGWFRADDPGTDERVVHALDAAILAEGEFAPEDPEYYKELDRRIAEYMPHRAKRANGGDRGDDDERGGGEERRGEGRREGRGGDERGDGQRPKRDAPRFRVGGRDRALKPNEVYLSKERREALEDMGAMDDPVLMKKYLKAFKTYDETANRREK